jgi:UDP-hydrolysing UDP-N-acetyl-D-glucosamine 2-epimerase
MLFASWRVAKIMSINSLNILHMKKRKICFVITSHIHYGRNKLILDELKRRKDVEIQIVVGASAILPTYGDVIPVLEKDGHRVSAKITMVFEGGSQLAMAKTAGIGISEFATVFDNLSPDIVLVRGDRYEVLSAATAAAYLNIPVAHIEGGDVTGTIDESVRHAVTKLSHFHFTTNDTATERVIRMGEDPGYVFNVGSPEIEYLSRNNFTVSNKLINHLGVGDLIDIKKPYLLVMKHPVTSEIADARKQTFLVLNAVHDIGVPTIWFWPNVDAGTDEISKAIRTFRENNKAEHMRFIKYVPPDHFLGLLKSSACLVGNSSAGIKESSFFGTPVINIGTRQNGRMRGENVIDVPYSRAKIQSAIDKQLAHGPYERDDVYYKKGTSKKIADVLVNSPLYTQKQFVD